MAIWSVRRVGERPAVATGLYVLAAVLFLGAAFASGHAIVTYEDDVYFAAALGEAWDFWKNPSFVLSAAALLAILLWVLIRPRDLAGSRPYACAAILVGGLVLSPLLMTTSGWFGPPYAYGQNVARTAGGLTVIALILFLWFAKSSGRFTAGAHAVMASPEVGRRLLAFTCLLLLATLPWNAMLVRLYASYLEAVREATRAPGGIIAFEATKLPAMPRLLQGEGWSMPITSVLVRRNPDDAAIAPPRAYTGWQPFPLADLPDLAGFRWRD